MSVTRGRTPNSTASYWRPVAERFDGSRVTPEGGDWFDSPYGDEDPAEAGDTPPAVEVRTMGRFTPVTQDGDVKGVAPPPHPPGRACAFCGTRLSVYNGSPLCFPHGGGDQAGVQKLAKAIAALRIF